jgi:hypothetical protein
MRRVSRSNLCGGSSLEVGNEWEGKNIRRLEEVFAMGINRAK